MLFPPKAIHLSIIFIVFHWIDALVIQNTPTKVTCLKNKALNQHASLHQEVAPQAPESIRRTSYISIPVTECDSDTGEASVCKADRDEAIAGEPSGKWNFRWHRENLAKPTDLEGVDNPELTVRAIPVVEPHTITNGNGDHGAGSGGDGFGVPQTGSSAGQAGEGAASAGTGIGGPSDVDTGGVSTAAVDTGGVGGLTKEGNNAEGVQGTTEEEVSTSGSGNKDEDPKPATDKSDRKSSTGGESRAGGDSDSSDATGQGTTIYHRTKGPRLVNLGLDPDIAKPALDLDAETSLRLGLACESPPRPRVRGRLQKRTCPKGVYRGSKWGNPDDEDVDQGFQNIKFRVQQLPNKRYRLSYLADGLEWKPYDRTVGSAWEIPIFDQPRYTVVLETGDHLGTEHYFVYDTRNPSEGILYDSADNPVQLPSSQSKATTSPPTEEEEEEEVPPGLPPPPKEATPEAVPEKSPPPPSSPDPATLNPQKAHTFPQPEYTKKPTRSRLYDGAGLTSHIRYRVVEKADGRMYLDEEATQGGRWYPADYSDTFNYGGRKYLVTWLQDRHGEFLFFNHDDERDFSRGELLEVPARYVPDDVWNGA